MTNPEKKERELTPFGSFHFPSFRFGGINFPRLFEDFGEGAPLARGQENLTVSEDDTNFYIEAALPGLNEGDIDVTIDENVLWIRGDRREVEEDKKKKFYRKASSTFSYSIALPENIDHNKDPDAEFKDGLMKVTFPKQEQKKSKKISFKRS